MRGWPAIRRHLACSTLAAGLLLGACESGPRAPGTALLTLADLRAGLVSAPQEPLGVGLSPVFNDGFPPAYFLASKDEIRIAPAFTEGRASAYTTTDIWVNFPEVWAQPLYIFVAPSRAGGAGSFEQRRLPLPWVVAVGQASGFWSPFFRVFYVEVPSDTPAERYRTVRDILNARLPVHEGGTRLVALLPDAAMGIEDPARILLPTLQAPDKIGLPVRRPLWVQGKLDPQTGLDYGPDRFELGPQQVILDQPLFFFFAQDDQGNWAPVTSLPRIGGTGPLFANRPALAPGNRPLYGSFWRLWAAHLPGSARVFVPRARRAEWEARSWNAKPALALAEYAAALDGLAGLDAYAFRVVLDQACLASASKLDDLVACPWLDSQAALERHLPAALHRSEILVTCPFVAHADQAVPPPLP